MGMVMVKCPQTGQAIPTGIETDRESFARSAVFSNFVGMRTLALSGFI